MKVPHFVHGVRRIRIALLICFSLSVVRSTNAMPLQYAAGPRPASISNATESVIATFGPNPNGNRPQSALIAARGELYGTTSTSGAGGFGTVFRLTPPVSGQAHWTQTQLYAFTNANGDGDYPTATLLATNGALYGSTGGGACRALTTKPVVA